MFTIHGTPMPEPGIYADMSAEDYHAVAALAEMKAEREEMLETIRANYERARPDGHTGSDGAYGGGVLRLGRVDLEARVEKLEWLVEVLEAYAGRHEWLTNLHGSNDLFVDRVDKHAVWADAQMELKMIANAARDAAGVN